MTEEDLRKGTPREEVFRQEREVKDRARSTMETVRIRHVIVGNLSCVKNTNLNRDANSAKSTN